MEIQVGMHILMLKCSICLHRAIIKDKRMRSLRRSMPMELQRRRDNGDGNEMNQKDQAQCLLICSMKLDDLRYCKSTIGQVGEASRPYFQGQRLDSKIVTKKEANTDPRSNRHEEDMDVGCEDKHVLQTFEGLEKRFFEDIMKLSKEQTDAEDAESARHKERKDAINLQYEEQLVALRARHSARRDDFFRRESLAREQQYQQSVVDQYSSNSAARPTDQFDSYREHRARYPAGHRDDHGFDPRAASYAGGGGGGRAYETGSRYY
ncbi:uncharacterized protein LOC124935782 isoform X1 [Impatiens glandulifera]|uniref:uncharacterized protein LOC124935782 isoform X1 n=1 Tax=Impatiens glandulifera TaxID=253017 RepID=UPI001FB1037D|nr:uncharacterized protein LOC124935782 isoform X1 [Impatiens glandulifera]